MPRGFEYGRVLNRDGRVNRRLPFFLAMTPLIRAPFRAQLVKSTKMSESRKDITPSFHWGLCLERAMRLELTTYSMASCRSSQLSYARLRGGRNMAGGRGLSRGKVGGVVLGLGGRGASLPQP